MIKVSNHTDCLIDFANCFLVILERLFSHGLKRAFTLGKYNNKATDIILESPLTFITYCVVPCIWI